MTTLTKKMAEDLTDYYQELGVKVRYLHSGHRDRRARRDHPRPAPRRVRRAGRHQPAARGARPAGGLAGGDPRRRQGRLPALGALADPDHRPRRAQRERHGDHVRRHGHRLDAARDRRDRPAARPAGVQREARHHAADDREGDRLCWWWPTPTTTRWGLGPTMGRPSSRRSRRFPRPWIVCGRRCGAPPRRSSSSRRPSYATVSARSSAIVSVSRPRPAAEAFAGRDGGS